MSSVPPYDALKGQVTETCQEAERGINYTALQKFSRLCVGSAGMGSHAGGTWVSGEWIQRVQRRRR